MTTTAKSSAAAALLLGCLFLLLSSDLDNGSGTRTSTSRSLNVASRGGTGTGTGTGVDKGNRQGVQEDHQGQGNLRSLSLSSSHRLALIDEEGQYGNMPGSATSSSVGITDTDTDTDSSSARRSLHYLSDTPPFLFREAQSFHGTRINIEGKLIEGFEGVEEEEEEEEERAPKEREGAAAAVQRSVLFLGDSLSRHVVSAACGDSGHGFDYDDTRGDLRTYASEAAVSRDHSHMILHKQKLVCSVNDGGQLGSGRRKIGHVHLFGSNPTGPYNQGYCTDPQTSDCATPERICNAIRDYTLSEGAPTHIVYAIGRWDIVPHHVVNEAASLSAWRARVVDRLRDVERCKAEESRIVLSTMPRWHDWPISGVLNDILKDVAQEEKLCVADYDRGVYLGRENADHWTVFRDHVHPTREMSLGFADWLLNLEHRLDMEQQCSEIEEAFPIEPQRWIFHENVNNYIRVEQVGMVDEWYKEQEKDMMDVESE